MASAISLTNFATSNTLLSSLSGCIDDIRDVIADRKKAKQEREITKAREAEAASANIFTKQEDWGDQPTKPGWEFGVPHDKIPDGI